MEKPDLTMTGEEYRESIGKLGMNMTEAAEFFGVNRSIIRRRTNKNGRIPPEAILLIRLMLRGNLMPASINRLTRRRGH